MKENFFFSWSHRYFIVNIIASQKRPIFKKKSTMAKPNNIFNQTFGGPEEAVKVFKIYLES